MSEEKKMSLLEFAEKFCGDVHSVDLEYMNGVIKHIENMSKNKNKILITKKQAKEYELQGSDFIVIDDVVSHEPMKLEEPIKKEMAEKYEPVHRKSNWEQKQECKMKRINKWRAKKKLNRRMKK